MELLGAPSGLATSVRPRYCRCFVVRSRCLSAPSPPSSFRVRIQFHPWSKQPFRIIPKAQSEDSNDVSGTHPLASRGWKVRRTEALERLDKQLLEGMKPPYVEYLMSLGFNLEDIRRIVRRYYCIQYRSVDKQIRPFVEVLQNVGVDHETLRVILRKWPQVMSVSIEEKFMPTMAFLESMGIDEAQRVKVLRHFPQILTFTRKKIEEKLTYFLELGISTENVHTMFARGPRIFGIAVERRIGTTIEFFLAKGFTKEEFQTMVVKHPRICSFSITKTIEPKWEFFLEMGYPTSVLVSFPQYFGYSLEGRIKPRHRLAMEHGVRLHFSRLLPCTDVEFEMLLKKLVSRRSLKDDGKCST